MGSAMGIQRLLVHPVVGVLVVRRSTKVAIIISPPARISIGIRSAVNTNPAPSLAIGTRKRVPHPATIIAMRRNLALRPITSHLRTRIVTSTTTRVVAMTKKGARTIRTGVKMTNQGE